MGTINTSTAALPLRPLPRSRSIGVGFAQSYTDLVPSEAPDSEIRTFLSNTSRRLLYLRFPTPALLHCHATRALTGTSFPKHMPIAFNLTGPVEASCFLAHTQSTRMERFCISYMDRKCATAHVGSFPCQTGIHKHGSAASRLTGMFAKSCFLEGAYWLSVRAARPACSSPRRSSLRQIFSDRYKQKCPMILAMVIVVRVLRKRAMSIPQANHTPPNSCS